jgi:anti-anti-sigma factor
MAVDGFDVTLRAADGGTVVRVQGPLDVATAPLLRTALDEACGRSAEGAPGDVTVDFEAVTFCGADVLGLLAATAARLHARGCRLSIRGARPKQVRVFRLGGLGHLLADPHGTARRVRGAAGTQDDPGGRLR